MPITIEQKTTMYPGAKLLKTEVVGLHWWDFYYKLADGLLETFFVCEHCGTRMRSIFYKGVNQQNPVASLSESGVTVRMGSKT